MKFTYVYVYVSSLCGGKILVFEKFCREVGGRTLSGRLKNFFSKLQFFRDNFFRNSSWELKLGANEPARQGGHFTYADHRATRITKEVRAKKLIFSSVTTL